jgi:hypothetical protein
MPLVSDSALDQTCPGAWRSLVLPEDGTSDHAAGVLAAAWTGLHMAGDYELTNTKSAMALRLGVTSRSAGRCH